MKCFVAVVSVLVAAAVAAAESAPPGLGLGYGGLAGNGLGGNGLGGHGLGGHGLGGHGLGGHGLGGLGLGRHGLAGNGLAGHGLAGPGLAGLGYAGQGQLGNGGLNLGYGGDLGHAGLAGPAGYGGLAAAAPLAKAAPLAIAHAPAPIPDGPKASQYHSQDELGSYKYGYENINSAKSEHGNSHGIVEGTYSYIDSYGLNQKVDYVADGHGFRATGTNFPNTAATAGYGRRRRSAEQLLAGGALLGAGPLAGPIGPIGPLATPYNTISAPATREAILTRIQNNPGHAVSYRVD